MPKETFFNLPEEKRKVITDIAIEEFGNHDYGEVSISRMVGAGIAKGSFYQYFEDKEDLYTYLLDLCVKAKFEFLGLDQPDPQHIGVFNYLLWTAQASVQMQLRYPDLVKIAYRALNSNSYPQKFLARAREETHKFTLHLIAIGKEQGDIAPEIDDNLAAFFFDTLFMNLGQYLLPYIINSENQPSEDGTLFSPELVAIFEQTLSILEHGMGGLRPLQESGHYSTVRPNMKAKQMPNMEPKMEPKIEEVSQ